MTGRIALVALTAAVAFLMTGCGTYSPLARDEETPRPTASAAPTPTIATHSPSTPSPQTKPTPTVPPVVYAWTLPKSDTSVNNFQDGPAYGALQRGDCDGAEAFLAENRFTDDPDFGVYTLRTPRFVVLLAAGIAMCRGDVSTAEERYVHARDTWGTEGLDRPIHPISQDDPPFPVAPPWPRGHGEPECDLYRALTSTIENVDPTTVGCPGGLLPLHQYLAYETTSSGQIVKWDDPLTPEDERNDAPDDWTGADPTPGTSVQEGQPMTGDPDDEFGEDPQS